MPRLFNIYRPRHSTWTILDQAWLDTEQEIYACNNPSPFQTKQIISRAGVAPVPRRGGAAVEGYKQTTTVEIGKFHIISPVHSPTNCQIFPDRGARVPRRGAVDPLPLLWRHPRFQS